MSSPLIHRAIAFSTLVLAVLIAAAVQFAPSASAAPGGTAGHPRLVAENAPILGAIQTGTDAAFAFFPFAHLPVLGASVIDREVAPIVSGTPKRPLVGIPVSLPTMNGVVGSTITVPVTVGELTGQAVRAYDLQVTFDPTILQPNATSYSTSGTLSSGMSITPNTANS